MGRGAATEPARSLGLGQTHGRELERRPADRGSGRAVSTGWEASAEVAGIRKQDKHYLQAERSSGVVELPTSAHLSMVVLIWL